MAKANLGDSEVKHRLATHLVPWDELANAGPYAEGDAEKVQREYPAFLAARAQVVSWAIRRLCDGREP